MGNTGNKKLYDLQEALKAVHILFSRVDFTKECIEVRCIDKKKRLTVSGWFDDLEILAQTVCRLARDGFGEGYKFIHENIYWTCNPVSDALLARQPKNRLQFTQETTADRDITRRLHLPIDIDPIRPSGVSATAEERTLAMEVANKVIAKLEELGFPEGSIIGGTSGNGLHVVIVIDLPNDEESKKLLQRCLTALQSICGNARVDIDQKVFNASRILKSYGTMARKGVDDEKRPWRMSRLTIVPTEPEIASKELLEKLAALAPLKDNKRAINAPTSGGMAQAQAQQVLDAAEIDADSSPENYEYTDDQGVRHTALKWKHRCLIDPDTHGRNVAFSLLENGWLNHHCMHKNTHEGVGQKDWRAAWERRTDRKYPRMFPEHHATTGFETDFVDAEENKLTPEQEYSQILAEVEQANVETERERGEIPKYKLTDLGNAERLQWRYGRCFHHSNKRGWYFWDKTHWLPDANKQVAAAAKITVRKIHEEAKEFEAQLKEIEPCEANQEQIDTLKAKIDSIHGWQCTSESKGKLNAMVDLMETSLVLDIDLDAFDADPLLFNCKNGTVDLRTGELRSHCKEDLITVCVPITYDPNAHCPLWIEFLKDVTAGDEELMAYLQRAVGYTLTGLTDEHCLFILHGIGRNGKSTFIETIQYIMGKYAMPANMEMFLVKKNDGGIPNDLAALHKARLVTAVESDDGKRLSEAKIKQITGGDTITARFLHKEFFTFKPQFKIWLATNHLPVITGQDEGIWRRIRRIPFKVVIPDSKVDETLPKKLKAEGPGILNWALKGLEEYRLHRLAEPDCVIEATEHYRDDQDWLKRFLSEHTEPAKNNNESCQPRTLYLLYTEWAKRVGEFVLKEIKFIEAMALAGYKSKPVRRGDKVIKAYEQLKIKACVGINDPSPEVMDSLLKMMDESL